MTRRFAFAAALALLLVLVQTSEFYSVAQAPAPDEARLRMLDFVRRAERLREFGRPLLARAQLDKAAAIDASAREVLIGYLRLYTRAASADFAIQDGRGYAESLARSFGEDYEACLEVAGYLFLTAERPLPPDAKNPKPALERLEAEMKVFLALADAVITPPEKLPEAALGRPRLSLAYLARAAKAVPNTEEVAFLAAQELDFRGRSYETYALADEAFQPFGKRAFELYQRAETLYRRALRPDERQLTVRIALVNLMFRLRRYADAVREGDAALRLAPDNPRVVNTLADVAVAAGDMDLLVDSLQARLRIARRDDHNVADAALELAAAVRARDRKWPFQRWREFRLVAAQTSDARLQAAGELLEVEPGFLEVHCLAAEELMNRGARAREEDVGRSFYDGALKALEKAGDLGDKLADVRRMRAECLWQLRRFKDASAEFLKTAELEPNDETARFLAEAALDIDAGRCGPAAAIELLEILRGQRDNAERLRRLDALVRHAPKYAEAHLALGKVREMQGAYPLALESFNTVLKLAPENVEALWGAAINCARTRDYRTAATHLEKLVELRPKFEEGVQWLERVRHVRAGGEKREQACDLWLQAQAPALREPEKQRLIEQALRADDTLFEALLDAANLVIGRTNAPQTELERAEGLLADAVKSARLQRHRAEARFALGRLGVRMRRYETAAGHFEHSHSLSIGDGTALLSAALAWRAGGNEASAAAAMRKLVTDVPASRHVRPRYGEMERLAIKPAGEAGLKTISPGHAAGDRLSFRLSLEMDSDGSGVEAPAIRIAYGVNVEVAASPAHGGLWKLNMTFFDPPSSPGYEPLKDIRLSLEISPWFGLIKDPLPAGTELAEIVGPAVQAVTEALCIGLGDGPVTPPYVWRNERTAGPPHFGEEAAEANFIAQMFGDDIEVVRRAAAGRRAGLDPASSDQSRWLEARVEFAGPRRLLRRVSIVIEKQELAEKRDDVLSSRLSVVLEAR